MEIVHNGNTYLFDQALYIEATIWEIEQTAKAFYLPVPEQEIAELKSKLRQIKFNKYLTELENESKV